MEKGHRLVVVARHDLNRDWDRDTHGDTGDDVRAGKSSRRLKENLSTARGQLSHGHEGGTLNATSRTHRAVS